MHFAVYFPKAFDRVVHYIILMKLRQFRLGGSLLKVIASYLQNRVQQVKDGKYYSDELFFTSIVTRDPCLSPFSLLFSLMTSRIFLPVLISICP